MWQTLHGKPSREAFAFRNVDSVLDSDHTSLSTPVLAPNLSNSMPVCWIMRT